MRALQQERPLLAWEHPVLLPKYSGFLNRLCHVKRRVKTLPLLALLFALPLASSQAQQPQRDISLTIRSQALPAITIKVDPAMSYLGHVTHTVMKGRATAHEYIFAEDHGGQLARIFIAHFEGANPGVDLQFTYPRFRMEKLGSNEYLHQSWADGAFTLFDEPDIAFLFSARRITLPKAWLIDRYVRAVDPEKHNEVIFFYLEPAKGLPGPVEEFTLPLAMKDERWKAIDSPQPPRSCGLRGH